MLVNRKLIELNKFSSETSTSFDTMIDYTLSNGSLNDYILDNKNLLKYQYYIGVIKDKSFKKDVLIINELVLYTLCNSFFMAYPNRIYLFNRIIGDTYSFKKLDFSLNEILKFKSFDSFRIRKFDVPNYVIGNIWHPKRS